MDDLDQGPGAGGTRIDAEIIMRRIRRDIRRRRAEAEAEWKDSGVPFDQSCVSNGSSRFDEQVYRELNRMHAIYDKIGVGLMLSGSPVPLIAPLVQRVRSMLHRLVIYYVNNLAATQTDFNEHVVRTLTALVRDLDDDMTPSRVKALEEEIADLRAEIEQLRTEGVCESE